MHLQRLLIERFEHALTDWVEDAPTFAAMIRGSSDPQFGDYQSNAAMPLGKLLGRPPREVAKTIVERLKIDDLCEPATIAGPGFINLSFRNEFLADCLSEMVVDDRLGVAKTASPQHVVLDFSSPNVAKPLHVGHIRSTVIGDSLARILRFFGENVVTDNHLGDWGTQFGIIIYGYKHFGDPETVRKNAVAELASLYRLTQKLIEYHKAKSQVMELDARLEAAIKQASICSEFAVKVASDPKPDEKESKKAKKAAENAQARVDSMRAEQREWTDKIDAVENDPILLEIANSHTQVGEAVLAETAKLHHGDEENLTLWRNFLPHCLDEVNSIYKRLKVQFDHTLGESFYHDRLQGVVDQLESLGLTQRSDGAVCVFLEGFESPMIVQKSDGAYLYATTDIATLQYRDKTFGAEEVLYVVDSRQSEHFEKLFALAAPLGLGHMRLVHVSFGTVLGPDGRPMKTRSGALVGLESLLDEAVAKAHQVACNPERLALMNPPMDESEQREIAEIVGIGAVKYADLSHHRTSDYKFDLDKMVALDGNTSTYIQYSYARTQSILRKASDQYEMGEWVECLSNGDCVDSIVISEPAERTLAMMLLRLEEAIAMTRSTHAPNHLCDYLYETSKAYSTFNEVCRVLGNDDARLSHDRLLLVALTGKVLKLGLSLLGIRVAMRM